MNLSGLLPFLLYQFKSESDLVQAIEEISLKFTKERSRIGDYLKDPRLVAAYTAFYLLTNIPKLEEVLKWMPVEWVEELKGCDFVDLGAGPGTFSLAWKELGGHGDFYQIELAGLMKEQGKKIWEGLYPEKLQQGSRWEWNTPKSKFLLFGHSANEMTVDVALDYIDKINPDHILFIEPGTKEFFPKMLAIRNHLMSKRYAILFPCPLEEQCPMRNSDTDWCHQFIQVRQNEEVERISQMARKDRKLLPLTVQAFSRTFRRPAPAERIVRVLDETKFSHEWQVCRNNVLERYQIMKKDLSKAESKALSEVLAGEAIETELVKAFDQSKRVKLLRVLK